MPDSAQSAQFSVQNPHVSEASLGFSPLGLDPAFPLEIVFDGQRDDRPITQVHIHDALEIGYCLEGSGTFYIGSKILSFHQGDVTVITDREFHRCRSSPGTLSRWVWFFLHPARLLVPHAIPSLAWEPQRFCGPHFGNIISATDHPAIVTFVRQLIAEARQEDAHVRPNLRALFVLLLNELQRRFPLPVRQTTADHSARALALIAPALEIVALHFQEPLSIPVLAKACGMSVRNFQLQFTRLMGCSPQRHLLNSRIQAATALLADLDRAITGIAYSCGFNTLSSFHRAFKAAHQMSPREFRRRRGEGQPVEPAETRDATDAFRRGGR